MNETGKKMMEGEAIPLNEDRIRTAAMWLSEQNPAPAQVIHVLNLKFGLSAKEGCEVCKIASKMRTLRGAFA